MRSVTATILKIDIYLLLLLLTVIAVGSGAGCGHYQYYNQADFVRSDSPQIRFSRDQTWHIFFKTTYFYPVRDLFDVGYQFRRLIGKPVPARNLGLNGAVVDSSFFTNRPIAGVDPAVIANGPNRGLKPTGPFTIIKVKTKGGSAGFIGADVNGYNYLIKLDDSDFPGLGGTAEIVASRIYWALGYFVPETFLITITGTNDPRFDGRRATASRFVPGKVMGIYKFDWVRDRREFRAMKLAAAWLNDVDRSDNNNLAAINDGVVRFYILDFNGALGSWQGRAKEPWQGGRYRWDVGRQLKWLATLGLANDKQKEPAGNGAKGPAKVINDKSLGYMTLSFEPDAWRSEKPNSAFDRMADEDAAWMARRIGQFSREQLQAIIDQAHITDPSVAQRLLTALLARREAILNHYLPPIGAK